MVSYIGHMEASRRNSVALPTCSPTTKGFGFLIGHHVVRLTIHGMVYMVIQIKRLG